MKHDHQRGVIKSNALHALVTSPLFRAKTEGSKKGKGSYVRKSKNKLQEMLLRVFKSVFLTASLDKKNPQENSYAHKPKETGFH
jgi:alternative ribosome-rescue factor